MDVAEGSASGPPLLGVSVHHLHTTFLDEVHAAGLDKSATIHEVEASVIRRLGDDVRCPRDGKLGATYVDLLQGQAPSTKARVAPATHLLSCSWDSALGDVLDALQQYCRESGLSARRTFVWLPCLCVSQRPRRHLRTGCCACSDECLEKHEACVEEVIARMRSVGKVLALVTPWDRPHCAAQAWCLIEMFIALSLGSKACELTCITPPQDAQRLSVELLEGGTGITRAWRALSTVRIESCAAPESKAMENILRFVRAGPGTAAVNAAVVKQLQTRLATVAEGQVRQLLATSEFDGEPAARICDMVGWLLREVSLHHRATALLQDGLQLSLKAGASTPEPPARSGLLFSVGMARGVGCSQHATMEAHESARLAQKHMCTLATPAGVALLTKMGAAKWSAGDQDGAVEDFTEARRICKMTKTLETPEGAMLMRNLGVMRWARGDQDGGLEAYTEARGIFERTRTLESMSGVGLLLNIGFAKADRGDAEGTLEACEEARRIYLGLGCLETPSGATLLSSIGVARGNRGNQAGALEAYREAQQLRESTGTLSTPAGALLLRNVGVSLAAAGNHAAALESYDEALRLRERLGTLDTLAGANLLSSIGLSRANVGDRAGALEAYRQAKRIHECTGTLRSTQGRSVLRHLLDLEGVA